MMYRGRNKTTYILYTYTTVLYVLSIFKQQTNRSIISQESLATFHSPTQPR